MVEVSCIATANESISILIVNKGHRYSFLQSIKGQEIFFDWIILWLDVSQGKCPRGWAIVQGGNCSGDNYPVTACSYF